MSKNRTPRQRAKAALKDLITEAGGKTRLAKALGIDKSTPYRWLVIPEAYLRKTAEVFNKHPEAIRPDLSAFQIAQAMRQPENAPQTTTTLQD
jgi:hypothetical protein